MGRIMIGKEPDQHLKEVWKIVDTINRNKVGKVIINLLLSQKRDVYIYPYGQANSKANDDSQAVTRVRKLKDAAPKGASDREPIVWYRGEPDKPWTKKVPPDTKDPNMDERYSTVRGVVGTGAGSDALVYFTPEVVKPNMVWDKRPDSSLFHELVHALRIMQGLRNPVPTADPDWMNDEEFWAVVVTNVYLSAGGSTRLRSGYMFQSRLEAPLDTSSGFLTGSNLEIFDRHALTWGRVYTDLAFATTVDRFNTFREFLGRKM